MLGRVTGSGLGRKKGKKGISPILDSVSETVKQKTVSGLTNEKDKGKDVTRRRSVMLN